MTSKRKIGLSLALAGVLLIGGLAVLRFGSSGAADNGDGGRKPSASDGKKTIVRKDREARIEEKLHAKANHKEKPNLDDAREDEEVQLSDAYKALLEEIQAALDEEDRESLVKIVRRMQDSKEWPDGIPSVLHEAAIDAMQWFGSSMASELVGYLEASDSEVAEAVLDAMVDMISDVTIGDEERSALLKSYARVVRDEDTLDTMIMELDNMRPTIRAETAMAVLESGNKIAIDVLKENAEEYFDDIDGFDFTSVDDLPEYLKHAKQAYIDDPELAQEDEELYGVDPDIDDE